MTLKTRRPTGIVPWPLILIEGGEKLPARFWAKVDFARSADCWIWTAANSGGDRPYGVIWDGKRRAKAHRWSWETANGPIPAGLEVDHLCRTPLCVRPSHMEVVTKTENVRRSNAPGARAVRENRCKRDHEYTPENTITRGPKHRECRACHRLTTAASKRRLRAARLESI